MVGRHTTLLRESRITISDSTDATSRGRQPDWSFEFHDGETDVIPEPPSATVDSLEFAKATLHHEYVGIERTSRHLQSLIRRAHAENELSVEELAVYSGLGVATVESVLMGSPLLDLLLATRS